MMPFCTLSHHAQARMQQRGIPPAVLADLIAFGRAQHDHHGGRIVYFDKQARRRLSVARDPKAVARIEKHLNAYAVVAADGTVTTVGHRYKRVNRA